MLLFTLFDITSPAAAATSVRAVRTRAGGEKAAPQLLAALVTLFVVIVYVFVLLFIVFSSFSCMPRFSPPSNSCVWPNP